MGEDLGTFYVQELSLFLGPMTISLHACGKGGQSW